MTTTTTTTTTDPADAGADEASDTGPPVIIDDNGRPADWQNQPPEINPGPGGGLHVLQGLVDAMTFVPVVGKDSVNEGRARDGEKSTGRWNYRSADAVITAANAALAKARLALIPSPGELVVTQGGKLQLELWVLVASAVDGSFVRIRVWSHATGNTAYTVGSAYSYGLKYALTMLLAIPFDDARMDMEATGNPAVGDDYGGGEEVATAGAPHGERQDPWWKRLGWDSEAEASTARDDLNDRLKALSGAHQRAAKQALEKVVADPSGTDGVWIPTGGGKGRLAPGFSRDAYAGAVVQVAKLEAIASKSSTNRAGSSTAPQSPPDGPPPGVDPDTGEKLPEAGQEPPAPAVDEDPETGEMHPTPEEEAAARRPSAASPGGTRQEMHRVFLGLEGDDATKVEEALAGASWWPIESIPDDQADEAAGLMADTLGL